MSALRQVVLSFNEGAPATKTPQVRGGKGAGLAEMTDLGLPIPPGFTIGTSVSRAFIEHSQLPKRLRGQLQREISKLEKATGRGFGNPENPLLVSVRSGAAISMPGMMDTVLNVGLTNDTLAGLIRQGGERFALDTWRRFMLQFGNTVLCLPIADDELMITETQLMLPQDPFDQLWLSIRSVLESWQNPRAVAYRNSQSVPHWWGTAINVQSMVFGNRDDSSCTGVVFSCNVSSGQTGLYGEFLPNAQGEDIVGGTRTPLPITKMQQWNSSLYQELARWVEVLTDHAGGIVDVEFTVEQGRLYILQSRRATKSPQAAVAFAVHQVWGKRWSREQAIKSVDAATIDQLRQTAFEPAALQTAIDNGRCLGQGLAASPGAAVGRIAYTTEIAQAMATAGNKVVLMRADTTPDDLPGMLVAVAIVTLTGGATCHAAVVARGLGLPAVVAVEGITLGQFPEGTLVSVDGSSGQIVIGELPLATPELSKAANLFLRWHARHNHQPRIGFEYRHQPASANRLLNDFYLSDEMARMAVGTKLVQNAAALRDRIHRQAAEQLACYLAIAVAGEVRHFWDYSQNNSNSLLAQSLAADYNLLEELHNDSDPYRAQTAVIERLEQLTAAEHHRYATLVTTLFEKANWSGSIGGPKWAAIAKALLQYLDGTLPPTLFVDHVYDLRHNGGRLFNKHPMFSKNTREYAPLMMQLAAKKLVSGVRELRQQLEEAALMYFQPFGFSPDIEKLYSSGITHGIW